MMKKIKKFVILVLSLFLFANLTGFGYQGEGLLNRWRKVGTDFLSNAGKTFDSFAQRVAESVESAFLEVDRTTLEKELEETWWYIKEDRLGLAFISQDYQVQFFEITNGNLWEYSHTFDFRIENIDGIQHLHIFKHSNGISETILHLPVGIYKRQLVIGDLEFDPIGKQH